LKGQNGIQASEADQDWKIVGTGDFNGDGKPDLLWRHCTLGLNVCWFMTGNYVIGTTYLSTQEFNTDWRIASQDTAGSTGRIQTASCTWLRATVDATAPKVVLTYTVPPNAGFGVTVQRRLTSETSWSSLASGVITNTYTDSTVGLGQAYEYRAYREG